MNYKKRAKIANRVPRKEGKKKRFLGPRKICRACLKSLPANDKHFATSSRDSNGVVLFYHTCKCCICKAEKDIASRRGNGEGAFELHKMTDKRHDNYTDGINRDRDND